MTWTLNRLEKTSEVTYIAGNPYIPASPGTAGQAAYSYWKEVSIGSYFILSAQGPDGYDPELGAYYKTYGGVKCRLAFLESSDGVVWLYTYQHPGGVTLVLVEVPAVPPVPPTPGQAYTPSQLIIDNRLGWNSGALGPAELAYGKVLTFQFSAGSVGAVVGLARLADPQDESYLGFTVGVMATSGRYAIVKNGMLVASTKKFTDAYTFGIHRKGDNTIQVIVNGGVEYETTVSEALIADSSLYSAGDVIWDTVEVLASALVINDDISGETLSDAVGDATKIYVTKTVGPGTDIGEAGAETLSNGVMGIALVDGTVQVSAGATTESDAQGQGYATKTLGVGTDIGVAAGETESNGVVEVYSVASGSADISFLPVTGAGADNASFSGWTGNYQGDSVNMLPMDGNSGAGLITPTLGIASSIMVPLDGDSTGITGEVSTSSNCEMLPMIALGNGNDTGLLEYEYGLGLSYMVPLYGFASDAAAPENTGFANLNIVFLLDAYAYEALPNRAYLRSLNAFTLSAYGGGTADIEVPLLAIEADGTMEGWGSFYGEIGYA